MRKEDKDRRGFVITKGPRILCVDGPKGRTFETIHECPLEIYPLFKERLKENMTSGVEGDNRCRKRRRDLDYFYRNDL